jgi:hypothetical protein
MSSTPNLAAIAARYADKVRAQESLTVRLPGDPLGAGLALLQGYAVQAAASADDVPGLMDEVDRLKSELAGLTSAAQAVGEELRASMQRAGGHREDARLWEKRYAEMLKQRDTALQAAAEARARLRTVRMLKVWTNEDRRQFVFADDLWAATDPDINPSTEPRFTDFSWVGNGRDGYAELAGDEGAPLYRFDINQLTEFIAQGTGVLVHLRGPASCCDGRSRFCETCGGGWADGEPYRPCPYACADGEPCIMTEPRPWHTHDHVHAGIGTCGGGWTTNAPKQYPHARCFDDGQHHAHRWGDPAHWCDGDAVPTPATSGHDTTQVQA